MKNELQTYVSHIENYLEMPDVEIVAGCDLIPGKAAKFFEDGGVEGVKTDYASHKEMLEDKSLNLDAVSICTYNRAHAEPAIYALKKGHLDVLDSSISSNYAGLFTDEEAEVIIDYLLTVFPDE